MYKVKVFDEEHEDDLSDAINHFLNEHDDMEILDIKYACAACMNNEEQVYCFSALLLYLDKDET